MNNSWLKFAFAEGITKAINKSLSKPLGLVSKTLEGSILATLVMGLIQMLGALIGIKIQKQKIFTNLRQIGGGILFGIIATVMTILAIITFTYQEADVGIVTFFITLSIIPGTLLDRILFNKKISTQQLLGIGVFIITAYAFLDFPSSKYILNLPTWVWLTIILALLLSVNETISKFVKKTNFLVYNFWIGLTTVVLTILGLTFLAKWNVVNIVPIQFWIISIIMGIFVLIMISAKISSYKAGGYIALKSLAMQSTYLILATAFGIIFFKEPLTGGKIVGIFGFIIAFSLVNQEVWRFILDKVKR